MKKSNLFNIATKVFGFAIVMAVLAALSTIHIAGIVMAITGAVVTGTPGSGTVSVQAVVAGSADLDTNYISKKVSEMRPAATPLDTIMRNLKNQVSIKSFVSEYYAVDSRPLYDTVNTAYTKAGDGNASYDLIVNNVGMWSAGDTLLVSGMVTSTADSKELVCYVVSKNVSGNTIKIQPLNGTAGSNTTAGLVIIPATIPISTRLVRMGSSKNELDAQHSPYAIVPVKAQNYMQIFMAQVEEGRFQRDYSKEVEWNFSDYEAQNIYDLRMAMEQSFLFGYKMKFYDVTEAKEHYTTGGITRYITKALEYGTGGSDRTIDNATFVDWGKSIFTGNSGSDTRFLFGGDGLSANLMKVDTIQKQIDAKSTEVVYGITFSKIETNFGKILYKHHGLLDYAGWGDKGIVLDLNNVEKHTFKPMQVTKLDLVGSGQRLADAVVIMEATGVITRYPDTHAIIAPKA